MHEPPGYWIDKNIVYKQGTSKINPTPDITDILKIYSLEIPKRIIDIYRSELNIYAPKGSPLDLSPLKDLLSWGTISEQVRRIVTGTNFEKTRDTLYAFKSNIEWIHSLVSRCRFPDKYSSEIQDILNMACKISLGEHEKQQIYDIFHRIYAREQLWDIKDTI